MIRLRHVLILLLGLMTVMWLTGCANTSDSAICDSVDRSALAAAVLTDAGPVASKEALYVLDQLKAGCG